MAVKVPDPPHDLTMSTATIKSKDTRDIPNSSTSHSPAEDVGASTTSSAPSKSIPIPATPVADPIKDDLTAVSVSLTKSERPTIGDWMNTWWAKKSKSGRPTPSFTAGSTRGASSVPSRGDESDASSVVSVPGVPGTPPRTSRKGISKTVLGTFGFPVGSSSSTASSRKRHNMSISDMTSVFSQPATPALPTSADSNSSPTRSAATTSVSIVTATAPGAAVDVQDVPSPALSSLSLPGEKPPQGSSLQAIIQATRVMTADAASILADQGRETSELVSNLALQLVQNARDERLEIRDVAKERKERNRKKSSRYDLIAVQSPELVDNDQTPTLRRVLTRSDLAERHARSRQPTVSIASFASPLFGTFASQQARWPAATTESSKVADASTHSVPVVAQQRPKAGSVPLESIIPANEKPPTQFLSRVYTPLTSKDFHFTIPMSDAVSVLSVEHGQGAAAGLTDRYGFVYEVSLYDLLLLVRAKECENSAPACLTGIKIADRQEDNLWPDEEGATVHAPSEVEVVKGACPYDDDNAADTASIDTTSTRPNFRSPDVEPNGVASQRSRGVSPASTFGRPRSATLTGGSSGKVAAKAKRPKTRVLAVEDDTPHHVCTSTIKKLLGELIDIHDRRQSTQRKEWDVFVNLRSKSLLRGNSNTTLKVPSGVAGAASILGLSGTLDEEELSHTEGLIGFAQLGLATNRDERREFDRLIRSGIPLAYRSKVWLECSGGLEMKEPGMFADLLASVDENGSVVKEIEKDVGRTMPLNIFFGRTGAGVDKLRRVLKAYSR